MGAVVDVLEWEGEQLVFCRDRETGLRAVIAIDDTRLGPALGGVRFRRYPDIAQAADEARRLAAAMTRKNAAAELPYGGGKSVIVDDGRGADREALMRAFGRFAARLGGTYIPGVDMGTTVGDLALMAQAGADVSCHDEDPSPWTAMGVWAGIRAAVNGIPGGRLDDVHVVVQGAGHVGASLAAQLVASGARVTIADLDEVRARDVARETGSEVIAADAVLDEACDVFAPCASAKVVDDRAVQRLRCRWIAGAANDTLARPELATALAERGIVSVPDFVLNAGGVIHIHALRAQWSTDRLSAEVLRIGDRVSAILADAAAEGVSAVAVAERRVDAALAAAAVLA